jgi:hypothetical protein
LCGNSTTHRPARGPLNRGVTNRGNPPRAPGVVGGPVGATGSAQAALGPAADPSGLALTIERSISINAPRSMRARVGMFYVKPRFRGIAQVTFGATNPRVELVLNNSQLDVELNQRITDAVIERTTIELGRSELDLMRNIAQGVHNGQIRSGSALRLALGTQISTIYVIRNWEIEPIDPPDITVNPVRAKISLVFGRATGQWTRQIFEMQAFGVPVRVALIGELEFDFGISVGGWRALTRLLARYGGSLGAATEMAYLETHLIAGGMVNGLLGFATPAIVVIGTPVVAFGLDYLWANYVEYLRRVGERRGLLNQAASGFIRRIFHPRSGRMYWFSGHPTGSRRRMRQAGVTLAEALLRDTPPEVLQAIIYRELDYHRRHQAIESDLFDRLGELWFAGRTLGAQGQRAAPAGGRDTVPFWQ